MLKKINAGNHELMEIFIGLSQVTRCCRQEEAFCEGVTFHQFMVLDAVAKHKELNMADLHKHLSVEKSTTTRLVSPLIQKKLLRRETALHDSRAAKLTLTKKGDDIHKKVWLCITDFFRKVMCNIPEKKADVVLESVKAFIEAIKNYARECSCCKSI
jgi:DNA-binding MarR family transcriptional regulator